MTDTNTAQQETEYAEGPPPVMRQNAVTFMLPAEFAEHFGPQVEEQEELLTEADTELAEGDLDEDLISEADTELAEGDLDEDLISEADTELVEGDLDEDLLSEADTELAEGDLEEL
jgi:hypothetical protein